jgi:site-specific DNA recombinase
LKQELRLILGRLEDFTPRVKEGLYSADWSTRREIIRALVKRLEIDQEQVRVVFRVDPNVPSSSPTDKNTQSLQDCGKRDDRINNGTIQITNSVEYSDANSVDS